MSNHFRSSMIIANWKMHKTIQEGSDFIKNLAPHLKNSQVKVCIAPSFPSLFSLASLVKEKNYPILIGGQNMSEHEEGAFTGEVSAKMLQDAGASFVILGHSERRHLFHEGDGMINRKVKRALSAQLRVVLCFGEKFEERERKETKEVLKRQLLENLRDVAKTDFQFITLSYEPVWAIGTGKVASPEDVEEVQEFCRKAIESVWGSVAQNLNILYGGSVKPDNAKSLLSLPDVDGLLIGGASLTLDSFSQIIHIASTINKES